jgi:RimJ/RimL family protein N-acetyltransferase
MLSDRTGWYPVVLEGTVVRLEPLTLAHVAPLTEVGLEPALWQWTTQLVGTPHEMESYVREALAEQAAGRALPFATIEKASGRVVGSTRFAAIEPAHRRVEIGWTWVAPRWQRTPMNTEAKYLMLRHAFEVWGCGRVEFKTDVLNARSRQALLRIGAKEEGTLRSHMITATGRIRDTVYFSVLASEWPVVRAALEAKLHPRG